ncbi:MAG: hypothetical protein NT094_03000 [Candidatus Staskawiczbacteria bacterium]|nr:hypothetical protein [Candidatus Staskawiczbacteria bacterium]
MKKFLKVMAWIFGIPLAIVLIFAVLGYMAIKFNFWPPTCNVIPLMEARRVCEFSKLDKAPKGKQAMVTFWVTVPDNTPVGDKIILAIDGQEPQMMDKKSETSFQKLMTSKTGEILKYKYLRNDDKSSSDSKEYKVKSLEKKIFDYVKNWNDLPAPKQLEKNILPLIVTEDTWTINYNMNLFEDTRRNLDSTFKRISDIGGKEVMVFSFIDFIGNNKETITLQETPSPYKQWRDAAIKPSEMKDIARTAKKYGLNPIIAYNVGADYTKYTNVSLLGRFTGGAAGSGSGCNAA